MRVAIAGAGNAGLFIANDLHATGHEVQLIEQVPAVVERAAQHRHRTVGLETDAAIFLAGRSGDLEVGADAAAA